MLFVSRARHAVGALGTRSARPLASLPDAQPDARKQAARSLASVPDAGPDVVRGLQPAKVAAAKALGFTEDAGVVAFGAGAVNNTLLALMSQVSSNLSLVSRYAEDIKRDGVTLHHRGDEYVVPPGSIKLPFTSHDCRGKGKPASDEEVPRGARIITNGRQLGGDYAEIFDAIGPQTEYLVTAQNGPSARMLADAALKYVQRHPAKRAMLESVVGIDAAMFVKMSATDSRASTILQPGAKWVFGAYELLGGGGVEFEKEVSPLSLKKAEAFTEWFKLLDATDAGSETTHVTLNPEAVSGKLAKTANNIGGNYGAAIVTKVVQHHAALNGKQLTHPLPYGVLHPDFDIDEAFGALVGPALGVVRDQICAARDMSLAAVGEYHDVHEELFDDIGVNKSAALDAAKLYWTEVDAHGKRIPSNHPPTHALAVFERRPSEPLLEDIIEDIGMCQTPEMRALLFAFRKAEGDNEPMAWHLNVKRKSWLETSEVHAIKDNVETNWDPVQLVKVQAHHFQKPVIPDSFVSGLRDMGEHAMSFQERLGEYEAFYEALRVTGGLTGASATTPVGAPPFFNLTIGGVYRDTPDRTAFTNVGRGYVTHATGADKTIVSEIFNRLGVDVQPAQVAISPLRSKVLLQHLLSLFKPGRVVAHTPTYASTVDAARNTSRHEIVEVPANETRFGALFAATRAASKAAAPGEPVILLLLEPHNPTAISMNENEAEEFHAVVRDCPNVSVIHDIAYQGYHPQQLDSGKRSGRRPCFVRATPSPRAAHPRRLSRRRHAPQEPDLRPSIVNIKVPLRLGPAGVVHGRQGLVALPRGPLPARRDGPHFGLCARPAVLPRHIR
jgi:hypothetical protein